MAFTLPDFNLAVDIYTGPWLTKVLRVSTVGNLAFGKRVQQLFGSYDPQPNVQSSTPALLLLPAGTDVRGVVLTNQEDVIEVPSGSGRWYSVNAVEDIGKGFSNEHRCASVTQISEYVDGVKYSGLFWPVPMP